MFRRPLIIVLLAVLTAVSLAASATTNITLYRFFGSCSDQYNGVTDLSKAVGECGIIQVLTNRFNAEHKGKIHVKTQTVNWRTYYNQLNATYLNHNPPAIAVMHRSHIANYASRHLLTPLGGIFKKNGINTSDFVPVALKGVTYKGTIYALPFDLHALLWHMNVGLLKKANLLNADGTPEVPHSVKQLMAQAKAFKQATGKPYILIAGTVQPEMTWLFETLVWQQDGRIVSKDLKHAEVDSAQGRNALSLINTLIKKGYMGAKHDYSESQQAFLNGKGGVLINGTWVINQYDNEAASGKVALKDYSVATFPTIYKHPAVWTDGHTWVLPRGGTQGATRKAAVTFLKYLYDNDLAWSRTGHFPVRKSVLESKAYRDLPHRKAILSTVSEVDSVPIETPNQAGIQDALTKRIQATYLAGKNQEAELKSAQSRINSLLSGGR